MNAIRLLLLLALATVLAGGVIYAQPARVAAGIQPGVMGVRPQIGVMPRTGLPSVQLGTLLQSPMPLTMPTSSMLPRVTPQPSIVTPVTPQIVVTPSSTLFGTATVFVDGRFVPLTSLPLGISGFVNLGLNPIALAAGADLAPPLPLGDNRFLINTAFGPLNVQVTNPTVIPGSNIISIGSPPFFISSPLFTMPTLFGSVVGTGGIVSVTMPGLDFTSGFAPITTAGFAGQ